MHSLHTFIKFRYGLTWGVRPRRSVSTAVYLLKRCMLLLITTIAALMFYAVSDYADATARSKAETRNAAESLKPALKLLEKCLSPGDSPIYVGDELWFVGAAPTGIKLKEKQ